MVRGSYPHISAFSFYTVFCLVGDQRGLTKTLEVTYGCVSLYSITIIKNMYEYLNVMIRPFGIFLMHGKLGLVRLFDIFGINEELYCICVYRRIYVQPFWYFFPNTVKCYKIIKSRKLEFYRKLKIWQKLGYESKSTVSYRWLSTAAAE